MTESASAGDASPLDKIRQDILNIERVCQKFERAWRMGGRPDLADHLRQVPEQLKARLFRALLGLDLDYRRQKGERPTPEEYRPAFPEYGGSIDHCFTPATTGPEVPVSLRPDPSATPRLPRLQAYEVKRVLGRGGMGTVYLAQQVTLDRQVALKVLHNRFTNDEAKQRFDREAKALARLAHHNIVPVHVFDKDGDLEFIVMEYCAGGSLAEKLGRKPLPLGEAVHLVEVLAGAVQHAHANRIIHRDLKPANVLFASDGTPKVADFGLAKLIDADEHLTDLSRVMGTPAYMAPEQVDRVLGDVDKRTDVYGLGAILYELLTGRPPFQGNVTQVFADVCNKQPDAPSKTNPEVGKELEAVCLKCLEKKQADRYQSAQELVEALRLLEKRSVREDPAAKTDQANNITSPDSITFSQGEHWKPILTPNDDTILHIHIGLPGTLVDAENSTRWTYTPALLRIEKGKSYGFIAKPSPLGQELEELTRIHDVGDLVWLTIACRDLSDDALSHLKNLTYLEGLGLQGCESLTDRGLRHLMPLQNLEWLDLSGCTKLTGTGFVHLRGEYYDILRLSRCSELTDAGLRNLEVLEGVEQLDLFGCRALTDDGLRVLGALEGLTVLDLGCCTGLTGTGLAILENVRPGPGFGLGLGGCHGLTELGFATLTRLVQLRALDLSNCITLTDQSLAFLDNHVDLQRLSLAGCQNLTDAGFVHLAHLSELKILDLSGCAGLRDAALANVSNLQGLRELNLSGCGWLTDAGLVHLKDLKLKRLCLGSTWPSRMNPWLGPLYHFPDLEHLDLSGCDLAHGALVHVRQMERLQDLDLTGCKGLTDQRLAPLLDKLTGLRVLLLRDCNELTDHTLTRLSGLVNLEVLDLGGCTWITDASLAALPKMDSLRELDLSGCAGLIDRSLARLRKFPALQRLIVEGCAGLTAYGLAHLNELKDRLQIIGDLSFGT
jgi:serine/threonine protein kinase